MSITATIIRGPKIKRHSIGTAFEADDVVRVAWDEALAAADEYLANGGLRFPYMSSHPLAERARCFDCDIDAWWDKDLRAATNSLDPASFRWAAITRHFSARDGIVWYPGHVDPVLANVPSAQIEEHLEPYLETAKLNSDDWDWATPVKGRTDVSRDEAPFKMLWRCSYVVKRKNLTTFPDWALSLMNKMNLTKVVPRQWILTAANLKNPYQFEAKTLLMQKPEIEVHLDDSGQRVVDVTLHMLWKEEDWEHYYRGLLGNFDTLKSKNGGTLFSPTSGEFNVMFPAPLPTVP